MPWAVGSDRLLLILLVCTYSCDHDGDPFDHNYSLVGATTPLAMPLN